MNTALQRVLEEQSARPLPLLTSRDIRVPVSEALTYYQHETGRIDILGGTGVVSDGVRTTISGLMP